MVLIVLLVLIVAPASAVWTINNKNVSNPVLLRKLLTDRIGTLDGEVTVLQNATPGINSVGTGSIFYVDSSASNGNALTWATAKTTLDAVIALCEDGRGDVVYVAQGHAETLAADITLDIDTVTIIMLGSGTDMPSFTYDTTTDEIIIDAQGVTIYGGRYIAGIAEVAAAFTLADESDYFQIIGGEFPEPGTATFEFDKVFQLVTGADNGTIAYCTIINQAATPGMTSVVDGGAAAIDSLAFIGNHVNVDADVAIIFSDQADTNLIIARNTLIQEDVDKYNIQLTSTATGIIADNLLCNLGGAVYLLDPGSCHLDGNRGSIAVDSASLPFPLRPGQQYSVTMNMPAAIDDDLFSVAGGPIWINDLVGVCSTAVGAASTWTIILDHATQADTEFTDAVDVDAIAAGGKLMFSAANPSLMSIVALGANVGSSNLMGRWYCPAGMIEVVEDESGTTGVIDWYMTFTPLADGVTVTPQ